VLVRVRAAGINPVEDFIRAGRFPLLGQPPFILGWDISGVVESVHPGVNRFAVGDEVYGMPLFPRQRLCRAGRRTFAPAGPEAGRLEKSSAAAQGASLCHILHFRCRYVCSSTALRRSEPGRQYCGRAAV
jgi:NADPH:quinone reductase-like Zn-dependent oxidoreductase